MLRTGKPARRITILALPILALLLALTLAPALAQEQAKGDYYTIKYDSHGKKLWHAIYDGGEWDYAYGVAADSQGNIIVTGATEVAGYEFYTIKYDRNGQELWSRTYGSVNEYSNQTLGQGDGSLTEFTLVYRPIVPESETVYLDGVPQDRGSDYTIDNNSGSITFKQAPAEGVAVTADYTGYGRDEAFAAAVDSQDNIIIVGRASNDYCVLKYDPQGNEVWPEPATYDGGDADVANSVAIDSEDNIIVTGHANIWHDYDQDEQEDSGERNGDYFTIRYDNDGNQLWSKAFDGGLDEGALEVVLDSADNIIVTGASKRMHDYNDNGQADEGETNSDYCTMKYDRDGNEAWYEPLFYDSGHSDTAYGAAVDSQDNIIVTGSYTTPPPQTDPGTIAFPLNHTYTTIKYRSWGDQIWKTTWDADTQELAYDVAVDSEDNVIVTGKVADGQTWNYRTIEYDKDGTTILWNQTYNGGQWDSCLDVAVDGDDNVIVTGSSQGAAATDGDGGTSADSGGLPGGAILGIALGGCAAIGLAYYYLFYLRGLEARQPPRAERRRKAAKQRKQARR